MSAMDVFRQVAVPANFRIKRVSRPVLPRAGPRASIVILREEAVLVAQLCDVRFGTKPPGKSRFGAIGRQ